MDTVCARVVVVCYTNTAADFDPLQFIPFIQCVLFTFSALIILVLQIFFCFTFFFAAIFVLMVTLICAFNFFSSPNCLLAILATSMWLCLWLCGVCI